MTTSDRALRSRLIRLAHQRPEFRDRLLPMLKKGSPTGALRLAVSRFQAAEAALLGATKALEAAWDYAVTEGSPDIKSLHNAYQDAHDRTKLVRETVAEWPDAEDIADALRDHVDVPVKWLPQLASARGRKFVADYLRQTIGNLQKSKNPPHDLDFQIRNIERAIEILEHAK